MPTDPFIKVCGVREPSVMLAAARAGATAIGLNFVPGSRRAVSRHVAGDLLRRLRDQVASPPAVVGVFADADPSLVDELRAELSLDLVQLHGHEPPAVVRELSPAIKAVRLGSLADLDEIDRFAGELLLVDARVPGRLGGTGRRIPVALAREAARRRRIILAGGLDAENVGPAIRDVEPAGVDTASGAEDEAGMPSAEAAGRFVEAAKVAFAAIALSSRANE